MKWWVLCGVMVIGGWLSLWAPILQRMASHTLTWHVQGGGIYTHNQVAIWGIVMSCGHLLCCYEWENVHNGKMLREREREGFQINASPN